MYLKLEVLHSDGLTSTDLQLGNSRFKMGEGQARDSLVIEQHRADRVLFDVYPKGETGSFVVLFSGKTISCNVTLTQ